MPVAKLKAQVKGVDGHRKVLRDSLDELRDEIRKPVNDWEAAEKERADEIAVNIEEIVAGGQFEGTPKQIAKVLATIKATEIFPNNFGERTGDAAIQKDIAISSLERTLEKAKQAESDYVELKKLRKQQQENEAKEAIRAAEDAAREGAEVEARAAVLKAEKEASDAREAAEKAVREADEKIEADRRAREAKEKREQDEADARAADTEHRKKVNRAAMIELSSWSDLSQEQAATVVTLISAGRIPNVTINY